MQNKLERYSRNILIREIGESGQKKLLDAKVLIAGAGGLGSTVIANLASVGVGNTGLIDNDILELSNLNRQYIHKFNNLGKSKVESAYEWIKNLNPEVNIKTFQVRLNKNNYREIIKDYDIIIDCFDSFESKFLLNKIAVESNKILIHGGVTEFYGQVMVVVPNESACLNCIFPDYDADAYVLKGVISPTVSTIASIESMEAVKIILGTGENLKGKILRYNGLTQEFKKVRVKRNQNCPCCG